MKKLILLLLFASHCVFSQKLLTPELLWSIARVSGAGVTSDANIIYSVSLPDLAMDKSTTKRYSISLKGGAAKEIKDSTLPDHNLSPDGKFKITVSEVALKKVAGNDIYPDLAKANVRIYDHLNFRHWDTWEDGAFSHLFVEPVSGGDGKDIMEGELFDCPGKPFGGEGDYTWSPDSKYIIYSCKKKFGTEFAVSTNSDLYQYELATGKTTNISQGINGYDTEPQFSSTGMLAWLSMEHDGYESDKNDIVALAPTGIVNLTANWDGTVNSFLWSKDGRKIYFNAPIDGTVQLFEIVFTEAAFGVKHVRQITHGDFDIQSIIGQYGEQMIVSRTDINHAAELYSIALLTGDMKQITHVNDAFYQSLAISKVEKRNVKTTDNKNMLVYVIYPPGFDPSKKYPTLLYCSGGPQVALTQNYSYRWNYQLMAANGYIVVAPNRRGMPGHGVDWNEQISKDHGGQAIQDLLSAIDNVSQESYVDKTRLGCVGASYGGYAVFYIAGIHQKRFKTFISHDGIFNFRSMYGNTEELFFENWDLGGPYWDKNNEAAQKSFSQFDPSNLVAKWDTPILIFQGGKDFRVTEGQAFEAFTAAQLMGLKSKLVYLPDENHWVLHAQNGVLWQREFYKWLKETL